MATNKRKYWGELSLKERAQFYPYYIAQGITSPKEIGEAYDNDLETEENNIYSGTDEDTQLMNIDSSGNLIDSVHPATYVDLERQEGEKRRPWRRSIRDLAYNTAYGVPGGIAGGYNDYTQISSDRGRKKFERYYNRAIQQKAQEDRELELLTKNRDRTITPEEFGELQRIGANKVAPYVGLTLAAPVVLGEAISALPAIGSAAATELGTYGNIYGNAALHTLRGIAGFEALDRLPQLWGDDRVTTQGKNLTEKAYRNDYIRPVLFPAAAAGEAFIPNFVDATAPYVGEAGGFAAGFIPGVAGDMALDYGARLGARIIDPVAKSFKYMLSPTKNIDVVHRSPVEFDVSNFYTGTVNDFGLHAGTPNESLGQVKYHLTIPKPRAKTLDLHANDYHHLMTDYVFEGRQQPGFYDSNPKEKSIFLWEYLRNPKNWGKKLPHFTKNNDGLFIRIQPDDLHFNARRRLTKSLSSKERESFNKEADIILNKAKVLEDREKNFFGAYTNNESKALAKKLNEETSALLHKYGIDVIEYPNHNYSEGLRPSYIITDPSAIQSWSLESSPTNPVDAKTPSIFGPQTLKADGGHLYDGETENSQQLETMNNTPINWELPYIRFKNNTTIQPQTSTFKRTDLSRYPKVYKEVFVRNYPEETRDINYSLTNKPAITFEEYTAERDKNSVIDSAVERIKRVENSKNNPKGGYNAETDRWYPHKSVEGGSDTVAWGFKLGNNPTVDSLITSQGYLTGSQADSLLRARVNKDALKASAVYDKKFGNGEWSKLSNEAQSILTDYQFNPGISSFPKLMKAFYDDDIEEIYKQFKRYTGGKPLGRNKVIEEELEKFRTGEKTIKRKQ